MEWNTTGLAAAFASGALFGLSDVLVRAGMRGVPPRAVQLLSILAGLPILLAAATLAGGPPPGGTVLAIYAAAGIVNFVVGRLLFYLAVTGLGAATASVITSPTILVASILAWLALGEPLTPRLLAGLLLAMTGAAVASLKPSGASLQGVGRRLGLVSGALGVLAFAVSAVLVRMAGLRGGDPLWGITVSYAAALPFVLLLGGRQLAQALGGAPARMILYSLLGVATVALAQLSRYVALTLLPVAVASVLISLFPLHTVAFARLLGGEALERVRAQHAFGALMSFTGVALAIA